MIDPMIGFKCKNTEAAQRGETELPPSPLGFHGLNVQYVQADSTLHYVLSASNSGPHWPTGRRCEIPSE